MNKIYYKKSIGTLIFAMLIIGISLISFSVAGAKFINNPFNTLNFDGLVDSVSASQITLLTSGTKPITVVLIDGKTNFVGDLESGDLEYLDHVKIIAKIDGDIITAKSIKKIDGTTGYGTAGDHVNIVRAVVTGKTDNPETFTVDSGSAIITFYVTSSTKFIKTTFNELDTEDIVHVIGTDSGINFLAKNVILKSK